MTAMTRGSCFGLVALVLLVQMELLPVTRASSSGVTDISSTRPNTPRTLQSNNNNGFALYSLPPFTVTFTTLYDTTGLPEDLIRDPDYLASTLNTPLKLVTSEFLMESFRLAIAANNHQGFATDSPYNITSSAAMQSILNNFMTVGLQAAVHQSDRVTLRSSNVGTAYKTNTNSDANNVRRVLAQSAYESFPEISATHRRLQFRADFFSTATFLDPPPSKTSNGDDEPTKEQVVRLLGQWIDAAFVKDKDYYLQLLHNSPDALLEHVDAVRVDTDSQAVYDPYATNTGTQVPQGNGNPNDSGSMSSTGTDAATSDPHGWTPREKIYFSFLIITSVISLAILIWLLQRYQRRKAMEDHELNHIMTMDGDVDWGSPSGGGNDYNPAFLSIGGRHADEVMDILNASDRYLATHRPDLLAAIQRQERESNVIPVPNQRDDDRASGPVERRYVTPTNPFAYLYGAAFFHRERDAVEQDQKHQRRRRWLQNRVFDPMAGVELDERNSCHGPSGIDEDVDEGIIVVDDEDDMDDDLERASEFSNEQTTIGVTQWTSSMTASPLKTFFTNMWGGLMHAKSQPDDEVDGDSDEEYDDGYDDYQGDDEANQSLACDEDPSTYSFPYQDFPRQDGTPCLIYEELDEEAEEQLLKEGGSGRRNSTRTYGGVLSRGSSAGSTDSVPLSNAEFKRALSQRALEVDDNSVGSSFQQHTSCEEDSVSSQSQFTDKLERLIAMRHRHYEKERIMENHREQRRREREKKRQQDQEELQRRDRLLRRHSLELDIQELEAGIAGGALSTKASNAVTPQSMASWDAMEQYNANENQRSLAAKWLAGGAGSKENNGIERTFSAGGLYQPQAPWHQDDGAFQHVQKPHLHRRTSSEAQKGSQATLEAEARRILDGDSILFQAHQPPFEPRIVQSARKPRRPKNTIDDVFRSVEAPVKTTIVPSFGTAMVSPSGSLTDTGSTSTGTSSTSSPANSALMLPLSSGSVRDGSSARHKRQKTGNSHASAALAAGYQHRRTMSFGRYEEKKTAEADDKLQQILKAELPRYPTQELNAGGRSATPNRHRRANSGTPAENVMLHGIYAQFV